MSGGGRRCRDGGRIERWSDGRSHGIEDEDNGLLFGNARKARENNRILNGLVAKELTWVRFASPRIQSMEHVVGTPDVSSSRMRET